MLLCRRISALDPLADQPKSCVPALWLNRRQPHEDLGLSVALDDDGTAVISEVVEGSPAQLCGLQLHR